MIQPYCAPIDIDDIMEEKYYTAFLVAIANFPANMKGTSIKHVNVHVRHNSCVCSGGPKVAQLAASGHIRSICQQKQRYITKSNLKTKNYLV